MFSGFSGASPTKYVVSYVNAQTPSKTPMTVESTTPSAALNSLEPGVNYKFWITPYNEVNKGPKSLDYYVQIPGGLYGLSCAIFTQVHSNSNLCLFWHDFLPTCCSEKNVLTSVAQANADQCINVIINCISPALWQYLECMFSIYIAVMWRILANNFGLCISLMEVVFCTTFRHTSCTRKSVWSGCSSALQYCCLCRMEGLIKVRSNSLMSLV